MDWIANTEIGLDPSNSVIKWLRCIIEIRDADYSISKTNIKITEHTTQICVQADLHFSCSHVFL